MMQDIDSIKYQLLILVVLLLTTAASNLHAANILNRIFDPGKYWVEKAGENCGEAELEYQTYMECRTNGYRDKRCNTFKRNYQMMPINTNVDT